MAAQVDGDPARLTGDGPMDLHFPAMNPRLQALLERSGGRLHQVAYGGRSGPELLRMLEDGAVRLNDYAGILLQSEGFPTTPPGSRADVLELPVSGLGFATGATLAELAERARGLGLGDCPLDLAPWLRLTYRDQAEFADVGKNQAPAGSVTVVSAPLRADDEFPRGFYLRVLAGEPWLRGYVCPADHVWRPADRLAFLVVGRGDSDMASTVT